MARKLRDSVVVITGASSGLGRASALAFARRNANLVLASRREEALKYLAQECHVMGVRAVVVPTDVTDEGAVQELARRAVGEFGRLDVWVNNAAVTSFGRFEETPPESYRRVIETNLFGYINGARAALPHFREQGGGILINVASVDGMVGVPYTSAYVASKFAIRGFSESLREEMVGEGIYVCTIMPSSIDTPLFQHSANYSGRAGKPLPPVYDPDDVAKAIVACAENPKREVLVGSSARMMAMFHNMAPGLYERTTARRVPKDHFTDIRMGPTNGNLFEPKAEWATTQGGWRAPAQDGRRKGLALSVLGGIAAAGLAFVAWRLVGNRAAMGRGQRSDRSGPRAMGRIVRRRRV